MRRMTVLLIVWVCWRASGAQAADGPKADFAAPPTVDRDGDQFVIGFAATKATPVRVVIVDADGRIVRHLAAGLLGPNAPDPLRGGGKTVLHEFCYGFGLPDPAKPLPTYWKQRRGPGADYDRISNHEGVASLNWYRDTAVTALMKRTRGIGRVCLDFWDVLPGRPGRRGIYNRWPQSSCAQREPSLKKMTWVGPDGAATTLRYEAFCEGIQYAEAMIVVSEAVDTKAAAQDLGISRRALCERMRRYGLSREAFRPGGGGAR